MLPRLRDRAAPASLGMASPPQNRMVHLTVEYMSDLAPDVRDYWQAILDRQEKSAIVEQWRRVERRHLEDACLEILEAVRVLPLPLREVLVARAVGLSWRRICEARPDRVRFSMEDDHEAALRRVWDQAGTAVCRVA